MNYSTAIDLCQLSILPLWDGKIPIGLSWSRFGGPWHCSIFIRWTRWSGENCNGCNGVSLGDLGVPEESINQSINL